MLCFHRPTRSADVDKSSCPSSSDTNGHNKVCTDMNESVNLRSVAFWQTVAESGGVNLHVVDSNLTDETLRANLGPKNTTRMRKSMLKDGWVGVQDWGNPAVIPSLMRDLVNVVKEINDKRQLPSTFLLVFEETWTVVNALAAYLEPVYGLRLSHDIFVFNAKPGYEGWGVHRDGSGQDNILAFQKEDPYLDQPTYTTTWLALTDAMHDTSCMFFIPAYADEDYAILDHPTGVDDTFDFEDDDTEMLFEGHRHLQPAPVHNGTALVWSHRTLHWSSASPPDAPQARLSLAFSMSMFDLDPPLIKHTDLSVVPPFHARVALVCYTGVAYHYNFHTPLKDKVLHLLLDILADDEYAQHLTDEAISPVHDRQLANQFTLYLERIYRDESLVGVKELVRKVARYIVVGRGLDATEGLRWLAGDSNQNDPKKTQ